MKYTLKLTFIVLISLLVAGCSDPKIDGTSNDAMKTSMKIILSELPEEKQELFKKTVKKFYMAAAFSSMGKGVSKDDVSAKVMAKLDGMTADEVFALAEEMKKK